DLTVTFRKAWSITHKAATRWEFTPMVSRGNRMAQRQRDQLIALCDEEWVRTYEQGAQSLLKDRCERVFHFRGAACAQANHRQPKHTTRGLRLPCLGFGIALVGWIRKKTN